MWVAFAESDIDSRKLQITPIVVSTANLVWRHENPFTMSKISDYNTKTA